MSDKEVKVGDYEAFIVDGQYLSIFTGDYEYGCTMNVSEWEAVKSAIDKMIAEVKADEKPTKSGATCR